MALFRIFATKDGHSKTFLYNNLTSELTHESGKPVLPEPEFKREWGTASVTSPENPAGKVSPRTLKISLGLSCNYECEYCSQRFVPRAAESNHKELDSFIAGLDQWVTTPPERVEFWGGEPLVYIKTLKPLVAAIKSKYPDARLSVITNGSLLTPEINEWIDESGMHVGMSHDGPGQHVRGPDPLDNPDTRAAVLDLYRRLRPQDRMSFNSMLNRQNTSRVAITKFFVELTGDQHVPIGEGSIVDAYDEGGTELSIRPEEHGTLRRKLFTEIRDGKAPNFVVVHQKLQDMVGSLQQRRPASAVGQKCGMDNPEAIAVDLRGNVLTCQNVSSVGTNPAGQSHAIGHVNDLAAARLDTASHWSTRQECTNCPVLQVCKGSCMFLSGALWETTCDNAFTDSVPYFAAGIEITTGYVVQRVEGPHRADRHNLWDVSDNRKSSKVIPIRPVRDYPSNGHQFITLGGLR